MDLDNDLEHIEPSSNQGRVRMLEGKKVNLRVIDTEDISTYAEWMNDRAFVGEFFIPRQRAHSDYEKGFKERSPDSETLIIETKDGTKAGWITFFLSRFGGYATSTEIGYMLAPEHRGKGYCTEAVTIILDYLFLLQKTERIQAVIADENVASKRILEKTGFEREGVLRKLVYSIGKWWNVTVYSILREEWKEPRILK